MAWRLPFLSGSDDGDLALVQRLVSENARNYLRKYLLAFAAMGVFAITTGGTAWLMRNVVDGIFFQQEGAGFYLIPIAMALLFLVRGIANYFSLVTLAHIGNAVVARLQRRVFDKILGLDVEYFARTHSADLVSGMLHHAIAAREALEKVASVIVRDSLTLLVLIAVMLWQNALLTLIVFSLGPIVVFTVVRLIRRTRQAAEMEFRFLSMVSSVLQETALGIRIVRAFNLEDTMRKRVRAAIDEVEQRANRVATLSARSTPVTEAIAGFAVAGILLWAGYSVINGGASPGSFIAFVTAMLLAYEPAARLARFNVQLAGKMIGVRRIYELLDAPSPPPSGYGQPVTIKRGRIEFDRIALAYGDGEPVLRGLSFIAEAGRTTALVGASGAGKTSALSLLLRFYNPSSGRILIDGQDIAAIDVDSLRSQIAFVSQDLRLFSGTVRENIRFGRLRATDEEVEAAAHDALADAFIEALPQGYDTELGEQGAQLSGGQRQRIAIARALLRDARIILLDEATSALDSESEMKVQTAFDRLKRGRTTIVVAHRLSTVAAADKICVLADGVIAEEGTHEELLAADGAYARLYRLQFGSEAEPAPIGPETEAPRPRLRRRR